MNEYCKTCSVYERYYSVCDKSPLSSDAVLGDVTALQEELAAFSHRQWSGWMKYLFSLCFEYRIEPTLEEPDGELVMVIPKPAFKRWQRQMQTDYKDLSEEEKKSDREEAAAIIEIIRRHFV